MSIEAKAQKQQLEACATVFEEAEYALHDITTLFEMIEILFSEGMSDHPLKDHHIAAFAKIAGRGIKNIADVEGGMLAQRTADLRKQAEEMKDAA